MVCWTREIEVWLFFAASVLMNKTIEMANDETQVAPGTWFLTSNVDTACKRTARK
jgi:hypothetical protein